MSTSKEPKPLIFSAFVMNTVSHITQGTWTNPNAGERDFNSLQHWVDLAKTLERGKFDAIFFADVVGVYGPHRGDYRKYVEAGLQIPSNDPLVLASALASHTEHLGIAITSAPVQASPFTFARQLSTLDHLSNGRIAGNIVTSYLENAFKNYGYHDIGPHDERYAWAEEYLEVVYKLWEGSWEDDALLQDVESKLHADYDKIHKIDHEGKRYSVEGPHLVTPSPQRTPLLFQADASEVGREFAARNAEATFFNAANPEGAKKHIDDVRARAQRYGRNPDDVKFFPGLTFVIGSTEEEAQRKNAKLEETIDFDAHLAHFAGSTGVDLGHHDLDDPIGVLETEGIQSLIDVVKQAVVGREPVVRDLSRLVAGQNRVVGTPEQIADRLETWRDAGIDGVNIINVNRPQSYEEFIDHVVPVLQDRGLHQREYEEGSLRKKLFGFDRLPERHQASVYRESVKENAQAVEKEASASIS